MSLEDASGGVLPDSKMGLWSSLTYFLQDIKLAHSVFALPFAAVGLLFAHASLPSLTQAGLLLLCMVTARSYAMGMNRYLDRHIDAANPRTAQRMIPGGRLTAAAGLGWTLSAGAIFCVAASQLSQLAAYLCLPVLAVLGFYSLMKRLSALTHWYLGFCLGLAPMAVSIALVGELRLSVALVGVAVMMWTAGFDILYSLQDTLFDRQHQLHSVPGRLGVRPALLLSRLSFGTMIVALTAAGYLEGRGLVYYGGVGAVGMMLAYEHWLVADADPHTGHSPRINAAFFAVNAWVSVVFYALTQLDVLL